MAKQLRRKRFLLAAALALSTPAETHADGRRAMVVQSCEATFDGRKVMDVASGTEVTLLGEQKDTQLLLVRIANGDEEVTGLVPAAAIVPLADPHTPQNEAEEEAPPAPAFDPNRETSAADLAEFFKSNRDDFKQWEGQSLTVSGVVESLRVTGKTGSMLTAEITLRTRADLPKVRLLVHASEFMDSEQSDRPELRVQDKTLEGRTRDRKYPYRYWYYANGYWRWRSDAKTEWVPIISVGHPLKASGVLSKYHIHLELDGATIDKG